MNGGVCVCVCSTDMISWFIACGVWGEISGLRSRKNGILSNWGRGNHRGAGLGGGQEFGFASVGIPEDS